MTRKCFLTVAWSITSTTFNGPYDSDESATDNLSADILGDPEMQGAVIGPLPYRQIIADGQWMPGTTYAQDEKTNARQWAVFEVPSGDLAWIAFGDESNLKEDFNFKWIGNHEGESPSDVFKNMVECDEMSPAPGFEYVAVPVGVFGPTDWMRVAGDMLTKIKG